MTFARRLIKRRYPGYYCRWPMVQLVGLSRSILRWLETKEKTSSRPCLSGSSDAHW